MRTRYPRQNTSLGKCSKFKCNIFLHYLRKGCERKYFLCSFTKRLKRVSPTALPLLRRYAQLIKNIKKDLSLKSTRASLPNISPIEVFSPLELGGVFGKKNENTPKAMELKRAI